MVVISNEKMVKLLKYSDLVAFHTITCDQNPRGIYAFSESNLNENNNMQSEDFCIATPFFDIGEIRVQWFTPEYKEIIDLQHKFKAHNGPI